MNNNIALFLLWAAGRENDNWTSEKKIARIFNHKEQQGKRMKTNCREIPAAKQYLPSTHSIVRGHFRQVYFNWLSHTRSHFHSTTVFSLHTHTSTYTRAHLYNHHRMSNNIYNAYIYRYIFLPLYLIMILRNATRRSLGILGDAAPSLHMALALRGWRIWGQLYIEK